ncbi:CDP-alcohol phosphatidyltransferase [uncultured archaeon]|nr:CDP-alcohol phosphatidyltransferase [uncultured archaeon]
MLGKIRQGTRHFAEAVAKPFAALGINPNIFSFLAIPLAIIAAYFIASQNFLFAFIFSCLAVSIDLFDGAVARLQEKESLFGNYFETMVDKVVEIILFIACAFMYPVAASCALGFSMLNSYAKPRVGLVIITDNRDWPAIGEHAERMILLLLGLLASVFSVSIAGIKGLEIFLLAIAIVALIGSVQRILYAKKLIEEAEKAGTVLPYLKKK